jgi:hypothetical protein
MTSEARASIENAIWLCADHAVLIDRDEVTYSPEVLRAMKRRHEAACARAVLSGSSHELPSSLLAIGPDIVCTGDVTHVTATNWSLDAKHFVIGDVHRLISFIDSFANGTPEARYVLCNELGDGRLLMRAPTLKKGPDGYTLLCPVAPSFPRIDVQELGTDLALHPDTRRSVP